MAARGAAKDDHSDTRPATARASPRIGGMSDLRPIRALRPRPDVAPRVSSVPYDVVSTAEARALAGDEPLSFLRVTRPELELPDGTDPYSDEVYERARSNFELLVQAAPLVREAEPSLYVYRLILGDHVQTGIAGGFSVAEYEDGRIKRHERTRRPKEDDRTRHMLSLRAQTGIVFLTHAAHAGIRDATRRVVAMEPTVDFTAADGVRHELWVAPQAERDTLVAGFAELPALYIADGHHRIASAWRARNEIRDGRAPHPAHPEAGDSERFLAVAFPDDEVRILPYHRVVHDLHGLEAEAFVAQLDGRFERVEDGPQPSERGRVSIYLDGEWRTWRLPAPSADDTPIAQLDCEILQREVLTPILGIGDLRTDPRIDFVGGIRGTGELERWVDEGRAAVAFAMYPVSVADLLAVSDAGEIMPPKSTWFEPKLRDGLLVHEI